VTPAAGRAIMAAVEQLTFGNEPAAVRAAAGPSRPGYEIERELAAVGASASRAWTRWAAAPGPDR
jgi:hypothetical protein